MKATFSRKIGLKPDKLTVLRWYYTKKGENFDVAYIFTVDRHTILVSWTGIGINHIPFLYTRKDQFCDMKAQIRDTRFSSFLPTFNFLRRISQKIRTQSALNFQDLFLTCFSRCWDISVILRHRWVGWGNPKFDHVVKNMQIPKFKWAQQRFEIFFSKPYISQHLEKIMVKDVWNSRAYCFSTFWEILRRRCVMPKNCQNLEFLISPKFACKWKTNKNREISGLEMRGCHLEKFEQNKICDPFWYSTPLRSFS